MKKLIWSAIIVSIALGIFYWQFTIFVISPIGALPEGKTLIIYRLNKIEFIDSPDAVCERIQGGVSLLCRGIVIAKVAENSKIVLRLPYSRYLYAISTGGKEYVN